MQHLSFYQKTKNKGSILLSVMVLLSIVILVTINIQQEYARKSRFATLTHYYYLKGVLEEITYKDLLYRREEATLKTKKGVYSFNEGKVNYLFLENSIKLDTVLSNGLTYTTHYEIK